jgi:multidrug resistance efflux pump
MSRNDFTQPFVCITCGAEQLYDNTVKSQARTIEQQSARLQELEKDAERYRWLRNTATTSDWQELGGLTAERTEEEIDAARAADAEGGKP